MAFKGIRFSYLNLRNTFSASIAMKVALFGVLLIPVIFAGFYLSAFLDPYARLDAIAVAVVNEDAGAEINGVERNLGKDVCDDLKNETEGLQWHFVSAEEAQTGLDDGTYYMTCTIPANFSETIASADSEHPSRADFVITYNESKNMLASQIGQNVWKQVQSEANESIIREYWENVFGKMNDASSQLDEAADGAHQLADGLQEARSGNVTIASNLRMLSNGSAQLESGLGDLADGASQVDSGAQELSGGMETLSDGSTSFNEGLQTLDGQVSGLESLPEATQKLSAGASQVESGIQQVNAYLVKVSETGKVVAEDLTTLGADLTSAGEHLQNASEKVGQYAATGALSPDRAQALGGDLAGIKQALTDAGSQAQSAGGALQQLSEGSDASQLESLSTGASQLSAGLALLDQSVKASVPELVAGIDKLSAGSNQLDSGIKSAAAGAGRLAANTPALAEGATQARGASDKITSGARELTDGSSELGAGLDSAIAGSEELASGIAEGADEMRFSQAEIDARSEAMSEPVELDEQYYTSVENYGAGFSPFFLGLGVWVGCIFAGFLFKPLNRRLCISGANPFLVAFVGFVPLASFVILQTLIAQLFIQFGLGVHINNVAAYYGMGVLCALCFMAIMQFLVAAFGFPGRFIAVVLLTLQLTSAAGTFPVETAPEFFQAISPWMPMTYFVEGMRQIMNGLNLSMALGDAGTLVIFTVAFFLLTVIVAYRNRTVKMHQLHPLLDL